MASDFPSFPLILEAYRECLTEDFDVSAAVAVLQGIEKRRIHALTLDVDRPSPFATALLFGYVATVMYDDDAPLAERRAHALSIDETQLQALLGETAFQDLLDEAAIADVHDELQSLAPSRRFRTADGLHETLLRLGDLSREEIAERSAVPQIDPFAETLLHEHRIVELQFAQEKRLVAIEDAALYRDALGLRLPAGLPKAFLGPARGGVAALLLRFARTRGPFTTAEAVTRFDPGGGRVQAELEALEASGRLIRGPFTRTPEGVEWCAADSLRRIRRLSLAKARGGVNPVQSRDYARFLLAWHGLGNPNADLAGDGRGDLLLSAIDQLQGLSLPASALEADILASRVPDYRPQDLDLLVARGEVVLEGRGSLGAQDGRVALYLAPNRVLLGRSSEIPLAGDVHTRVRRVLDEKGALFLPQIEAACPDLKRREVLDALWDLFWNGEVTNDSTAALRVRAKGPGKIPGKRFVSSRMGRYRSRLDIPGDGVGRFSRLTSAPRPSAESQLATLEQWLSRHGVLTREAISAEAREGGFSAVYPFLRALEERGQVRRGYFIEGLGALQFADPSAVDRMRDLKERESGETEGRAAVLAAADPANPFGVALPWPAWCEGRGERRARTHVLVADGELTALLFGDGARAIVHLPDDEPERSHLGLLSARALAAWMRQRSLRIIGHEPAGEALNTGPLSSALREAGLIPTGPGFRPV